MVCGPHKEDIFLPPLVVANLAILHVAGRFEALKHVQILQFVLCVCMHNNKRSV